MRKELMKRKKFKKHKRYIDQVISKMIFILEKLVEKYNELESRIAEIDKRLEALEAEENKE